MKDYCTAGTYMYCFGGCRSPGTLKLWSSSASWSVAPGAAAATAGPATAPAAASATAAATPRVQGFERSLDGLLLLLLRVLLEHFRPRCSLTAFIVARDWSFACD